MDAFQINGAAWQEYYLSASYQYDENFSIGGNIKTNDLELESQGTPEETTNDKQGNVNSRFYFNLDCVDNLSFNDFADDLIVFIEVCRFYWVKLGSRFY